VIASLKGLVTEKNASDAVVEVQGVGYRVNLSLLALSKLPELGAATSLRIRTVVREDAFDLFGFLSRTEEDLFLLLTSVSHVGPKMALNVMSGLDVDALIGALAKGEVVRLTKIRGVGRKTAERLVLELKEKVKLLSLEGRPQPSGTRPSAPASDLISALINLGYKEAQAESAAQTATERAGEEAGFELQFREALKVLRG
jgi:Holliday junction DNA helicase RuvA